MHSSAVCQRRIFLVESICVGRLVPFNTAESSRKYPPLHGLRMENARNRKSSNRYAGTPCGPLWRRARQAGSRRGALLQASMSKPPLLRSISSDTEST